MLVAMFNAVKVESVPLNFNKFVATHRPGVPISPLYKAHAGPMRPVVLAIAAALMVFSIAPAQATTDEDQVRAALDGMNASYNSSDFGAFASHVCTDLLRSAGYEAGWYASRTSDGPTQITVSWVVVAGDDAVANVRFQSAEHEDAKTLDMEFLREGGEWKACRYESPRAL